MSTYIEEIRRALAQQKTEALGISDRKHQEYLMNSASLCSALNEELADRGGHIYPRLEKEGWRVEISDMGSIFRAIAKFFAPGQDEPAVVIHYDKGSCRWSGGVGGNFNRWNDATEIFLDDLLKRLLIEWVPKNDEALVDAAARALKVDESTRAKIAIDAAVEKAKAEVWTWPAARVVYFSVAWGSGEESSIRYSTHVRPGSVGDVSFDDLQSGNTITVMANPIVVTRLVAAKVEDLPDCLLQSLVVEVDGFAEEMFTDDDETRYSVSASNRVIVKTAIKIPNQTIRDFTFGLSGTRKVKRWLLKSEWSKQNGRY